MTTKKQYNDLVKQFAKLRKENLSLKVKIRNYDKIIKSINKAIWRIQ